MFSISPGNFRGNGGHRGSFDDGRDGGFKRHGSNNDMNNREPKRGGFDRGGSRGGRGGGDRGRGGRGGGRGGARGGGGGRPLVPY